MFSFAALEKAWRQAQLATEREHVTPYLAQLRTFPHFAASNTVSGAGVDRLRWTVDEPCDFAFVRAVYERFNGRVILAFTTFFKS